MTNFKGVRLAFLIIIFSSIFATFTKILWSPKQEPVNQFPPLNFPNFIPLSEWEFQGSQTLPIINSQTIKSAHRYQYQKEKIVLDIEMRYLVNTDAHLPDLIKSHSQTKNFTPRFVVKSYPSIGYYGLFLDQGRAYLSSCINPRGETTVNHDQSNYNRYHYLTIDRIIPWLFGRGRIDDRRCLWTQMSFPLDKMSPDVANPLLEKTWVIWYQWWFPRFPNS